MRVSLVCLTLALVACATQPVTPRTPEKHAANVAAAQAAGYRVVQNGERTSFCPTLAATGSHMQASCVSESQFEQMMGLPRSQSSAAHYTNTTVGPGPNAGH